MNPSEITRHDLQCVATPFTPIHEISINNSPVLIGIRRSFKDGCLWDAPCGPVGQPLEVSVEIGISPHHAALTEIVEKAYQAEKNISGYWIPILSVVEYGKQLAAILGADADIVEIAALLYNYAGVRDRLVSEDYQWNAPSISRAIQGFTARFDRRVKLATAATRSGSKL